MSYEVRYMDRRGAGCMRRFNDTDALVAFVSKLRTEATISLPSGREIGRVWRNSGECDDRRVKWLWSFETQYA